MSQNKGPALVVLAAGLGSRYGGFKQLDTIGADNESIMDLSIQDAIKAGFQKIVLVINRQISEKVENQTICKYRSSVDIQKVYQDLDMLPNGFRLPKGRTKPWGTAHAILTARNAVDTPFAVINADDFYGTSAFVQMQTELSALSNDSTQYCLLGYQLLNTLSIHGGVSRGLCTITDNNLSAIREMTDIRKTGDSIFGDFNGERLELSSDSIVSMNFWGFTPQVFIQLEELFVRFLQKHLQNTNAEFFITDALDEAVNKGLSQVKVLTTTERWFGVTFREDRDEVKKGIQEYYDLPH